MATGNYVYVQQHCGCGLICRSSYRNVPRIRRLRNGFERAVTNAQVSTESYKNFHSF